MAAGRTEASEQLARTGLGGIGWNRKGSSEFGRSRKDSKGVVRTRKGVVRNRKELPAAWGRARRACAAARRRPSWQPAAETCMAGTRLGAGAQLPVALDPSRDQRSEVIRSHIRSHRKSPEAARSRQKPSEAARSHRKPPEAIKSHQKPPGTISAAGCSRLGSSSAEATCQIGGVSMSRCNQQSAISMQSAITRSAASR